MWVYIEKKKKNIQFWVLSYYRFKFQIFFNIILFIYFWLCWVLVAAQAFL